MSPLTPEQRARRAAQELVLQKLALEARFGRVWTEEELLREFRVMGYMQPFVNVERLDSGLRGVLRCTKDLRFYFDWKVGAW